MKHRYFSLFILVLIFCLNGYSPARAAVFQQLKDDKLEQFVDNNTFWKTYNLDRVYFNENGQMIQQLNSGWNNIPMGTLLKGQWFLNENMVCWTYNTETKKIFPVSDKPYCYSVFSDAPEDTFMTLHTEKFYLYQVIEGSLQKTPAFEWNRWAYGNYVLDPNYVPVITKELNEVRAYRDGFDISDGTIDRSKLNPTMQNYYDIAIGNIFFVGGDMMYFSKDGQYFSTRESLIESADSIEAAADDSRFGRWTMKNNWHCYQRGSRKPTCELVIDSGKGLIRPYKGVFGFHHQGFSRVHGEMSVGHIAPEDSSYPELFELVDEKFKKRAAKK